MDVIYGKSQPGVLPLPAHKAEDGTVTTCWKLSKDDIKELQETGEIWLQCKTFNEPLQPLFMSVQNPVKDV